MTYWVTSQQAANVIEGNKDELTSLSALYFRIRFLMRYEDLADVAYKALVERHEPDENRNDYVETVKIRSRNCIETLKSALAPAV